MKGRDLLLPVITAVAFVATSHPLQAQSVDALGQRCVALGAPVLRCTELAVAARSLQGDAGLLAGLGSEVSGSAGTLGRRLGITPRVSVGARAAFAHLALPDLADPGTEPSREASFVVPAVHGGVAVGLFDGFSVLPTVGGLLSLDLVGQANVTFLPTGEGFDGRTAGFSVGARVGILRESFTLPGVSVSIARRSLGTVRFGDAAGPGGGAVEVDPTVTSIRATVGKDLLSVGVLLGMGWDRYGGSASVRAGLEDGAVVQASSTSFENRRTLVFGGASMNFLVLQLSAEAGLARGFGAVNGYRGTPFDAARSTAYGSLAFRLTL
ncbi:MAG TPA: hypothetical protein VLA36_09000 [Longimicrobiales bacterium]|nr:hypothetical protein [Longimicrobiales bacterium]